MERDNLLNMTKAHPSEVSEVAVEASVVNLGHILARSLTALLAVDLSEVNLALPSVEHQEVKAPLIENDRFINLYSPNSFRFKTSGVLGFWGFGAPTAQIVRMSASRDSTSFR